MSRRKKGNPVHGWLVLDKPYDMTSTEAVGKVRWLFAANKGGHAGTLDPLASGVLPVAIGEATKLSGMLLDSDKCYLARVRLGQPHSGRVDDVVEVAVEVQIGDDGSCQDVGLEEYVAGGIEGLAAGVAVGLVAVDLQVHGSSFKPSLRPSTPASGRR